MKTKQTSHSLKKRTLGFEQLEQRRMMSGSPTFNGNQPPFSDNNPFVFGGTKYIGGVEPENRPAWTNYHGGVCAELGGTAATNQGGVAGLPKGAPLLSPAGWLDYPDANGAVSTYPQVFQGYKGTPLKFFIQTVGIATIFTDGSPLFTQLNLVSCHAYDVTSYDASSQTFTLANPWGCYEPQPLTWSELTEFCTYAAVANASNTTATEPSNAALDRCFAEIASRKALRPSMPRLDAMAAVWAARGNTGTNNNNTPDGGVANAYNDPWVTFLDYQIDWYETHDISAA